MLLIFLKRVSAAMLAGSCTALVACGPTVDSSAYGGPDSMRNRSSYALWSELGATSDTRTIMLLEAELAARGETQSPSGSEYLGRKTSGTVGRRFYARSEAISGDRNCSDFSSGAEAQRFFLAAGGPVRDPHGLDRDGDGNACEWGKTLRSSVSSHRQYVARQASAARSYQAASRCYVGPRGGTYTITASGNKNYGGC